MWMPLSSSFDLQYARVVAVDGVPLIVPDGPGEHEFDHCGDLILPPVAHGSPAQKRDALMATILEKKIWVHFARDAVKEVISRGCINPRAKMMLPLGVLVDFRVPSSSEGGLEGALEKYGKDQGEDLAVYLDMQGTVIGFLKPHIDQVAGIQEMIAPYYEEPSTLIKMLAPSMLSSRAPSSQGQSSSGSEGFVTPAKDGSATPAKDPKDLDIGFSLSHLLDKFVDVQNTSF